MGELSRWKSAGEFAKDWARQKGELSKRAEGGAFPDKGTPEQQAAWRKANNVPDAGTLDGYGIKAPDGYEMSNVEKAALGELASGMHGLNVAAPVMQKITDTFFRAQAANQQMLNELDNAKQKEGRAAFDKEHGKDAEQYLSVANVAFEQIVPDADVRTAILNARLPGGGKLASHPAFMNLMVEYGLKTGFGDRIEAGGMESGGKSLAEQRREFDEMRRKDPARYNQPENQKKYERILDLMVARGEIDPRTGEPIQKR